MTSSEKHPKSTPAAGHRQHRALSVRLEHDKPWVEAPSGVTLRTPGGALYRLKVDEGDGLLVMGIATTGGHAATQVQVEPRAANCVLLRSPEPALPEPPVFASLMESMGISLDDLRKMADGMAREWPVLAEMFSHAVGEEE